MVTPVEERTEVTALISALGALLFIWVVCWFQRFP
jgi:hypothetical protein